MFLKLVKVILASQKPAIFPLRKPINLQKYVQFEHFKTNIKGRNKRGKKFPISKFEYTLAADSDSHQDLIKVMQHVKMYTSYSFITLHQKNLTLALTLINQTFMKCF